MIPKIQDPNFIWPSTDDTIGIEDMNNSSLSLSRSLSFLNILFKLKVNFKCYISRVLMSHNSTEYTAHMYLDFPKTLVLGSLLARWDSVNPWASCQELFFVVVSAFHLSQLNTCSFPFCRIVFQTFSLSILMSYHHIHLGTTKKKNK